MAPNKLFGVKSIESRAREFYNSEKTGRLRKFDHPVVKAHVTDKLNFIKKNIKFSKKTKVLEVGAGNGYFSYYLADFCDLLVTDINRETLLLNPVKKKMIADANKLPFKDDSFDVVMCFDVLHHVDNPEKVVKELNRVSRKYVILVEPNSENFIYTLIFLFIPREWGSIKFTTKYFKNLICGNNLKILKFKHVGRFTTPNTPLPFSLVKRFPYSSSPQLNFHN